MSTSPSTPDTTRRNPMKRTPRSRRLFATAIIAAAAATGPGAANVFAGPAGPDVPDEIAVEAGHKVFLVGHAVGVQIYACNASGDTFKWSFSGPRANLFDDAGKLIATHYAGPTWETRDASAVKATRVDGVIVDEKAIPWLLLKRVPGGTDGRLAATTFIQRVATTGGLEPPAPECNAGTAGTVDEVPYTADYHFWKATGF
jgi:Protein of unknown function (DUF3455)